MPSSLKIIHYHLNVPLKNSPFFLFAVADQLQNLWGQTPPSSGSSFTTPSPPDHVAVSGSGNSHNLHSLFTSSPLLAANAAAAAAAAAASLSLPPPPPPPQASGSRLHSPGSAEAELYGGQSGSYTPFTSFHQVCKQTADFLSKREFFSIKVLLDNEGDLT